MFPAYQTSAQQTVDPGCLKADQNFCRDKDSIPENICNSTHEIEIRLAIRKIEKLHEDYSQIILTYDNSNWKATKYNFVLREVSANPYKAIYIIDKTIPLKAMKGFNQLFESLKVNDIFCLPDQRDILADTLINGGVFYDLTFKVGKNFRSYFFFNPNVYTARSSRKEFTKYKNIADVFEKQLSSQ